MFFKKMISVILMIMMLLQMSSVCFATNDQSQNETETDQKTNTTTSNTKNETTNHTNTAKNETTEEKKNQTTNTNTSTNTANTTNTTSKNTTSANTTSSTKQTNKKNQTNTNKTNTSASESNSSVEIEYDKTDLTDKGIQELSLMAISTSGKMQEIELTPEFETNVYEYECEVPGTTESIDYSIIPTENTMSYEVFGEENLLHGENVLTILVSNSKKTEYITYQIKVNKTLDGVDVNDYLTEGAEKIRTQKIIIIVWISLIVIGIIILFIGRKRIASKNRQNNRRKRS